MRFFPPVGHFSACWRKGSQIWKNNWQMPSFWKTKNASVWFISIFYSGMTDMIAFAKKPTNASECWCLITFLPHPVCGRKTFFRTLEKWPLKPMPLLFATISAAFPIDFLGRLAEKIANGYHMIAGHLVTSYKQEQVDKHPHYSREPGGGGNAMFYNSRYCFVDYKALVLRPFDCEWLLNDR